MIWRPHRSRGETQAYVERCIATPAEVERTYMLVGREDNAVRGAFALRQRAPHRLDCGYGLARRWWRQGLMTEALTEVAVWALTRIVHRTSRTGYRQAPNYAEISLG